jgi:hypothetical protein
MPLGGLITLVILLPNLLILIFPPAAVPPEVIKTGTLPRVMEITERVGQVAAFTIPFFYFLPPLRSSPVDILVVMALALLFYYAGWARYLIKGRRFTLLFQPMLGVPLPMAISPVVYFAAVSVYLKSWPEAVAAAVLAVGHLYVSQGQWQRCQSRRIIQPG